MHSMAVKGTVVSYHVATEVDGVLFAKLVRVPVGARSVGGAGAGSGSGSGSWGCTAWGTMERLNVRANG